MPGSALLTMVEPITIITSVLDCSKYLKLFARKYFCVDCHEWNLFPRKIRRIAVLTIYVSIKRSETRMRFKLLKRKKHWRSNAPVLNCGRSCSRHHRFSQKLDSLYSEDIVGLYATVRGNYSLNRHAVSSNNQ